MNLAGCDVALQGSRQNANVIYSSISVGVVLFKGQIWNMLTRRAEFK